MNSDGAATPEREDAWDGGFDLLPVTLDDLWAIHDFVRQHDKLGKEWDKDFNTRVMEAIAEAEARGDHTASLFCLEEELWQIDRQVPSALMVGTKPVGRPLLGKVMRLLVKMRGGEDDADGGHPGTDTGQSTGGDAHSAATSR